MATYETTKDSGMAYPLTAMNFLVTVEGISGTAAFTNVSGVEATVQEITFRQGNAHSLAPVKIPGIVTHGTVTLQFGYTLESGFKTWIQECVSEVRKEMPRKLVQIELIDTNPGAPGAKVTSHSSEKPHIWQLKNAWVSHYDGVTLDAGNGAVAMESVTITYEELVIPN